IDEPIAAVGRSAVAAAGISAEIRVRGAVVTTLIVVDDAVAATGQRAVDSARVRLRIGVVVAVVALLGTIELTVAAELTGRAARKIEATIGFTSHHAGAKPQTLAGRVIQLGAVALLVTIDRAISAYRGLRTTCRPRGRHVSAGARRTCSRATRTTAAGRTRPTRSRRGGISRARVVVRFLFAATGQERDRQDRDRTRHLAVGHTAR